MQNMNSKHGTLGDFDPTGSGTDLADSVMSRLERMQEDLDEPLHLAPPREFVGTRGNLDSPEGFTVALIAEDYPRDRFGELTDWVVKKFTAYTLSNENPISGTYNVVIRVSQDRSHDEEVLVACSGLEQISTFTRICAAVIPSYSENSGAMARVIVAAREEAGIGSFVFDPSKA